MKETRDKVDKIWVDDQIKKFKVVFPRYEKYSEVLHLLLQKVAKKLDATAIIQTRPKSISSFAEKIVRKYPKYQNPVNQLTDLCGARVITDTQSHVKEISKFIEEHFIIDWDNSIDVSQRLKPTEFGYRSIHYIIQFNPDDFPIKDIDLKIPKTVFGLKAEIQVRTILEHAWADMYHEWVYKNQFEIPVKLKRELAALSARLESADNSFSGVQKELQNYFTSYGAYMTSEQMLEEVEKLEITLKYDPENLSLVKKLARLALVMEEWDKAIKILSKYERSNDQIILKDLGFALCKKYDDKPKSTKFIKGQGLLLRAGSPPHNNSDALSSLAGTWKGIDDKKSEEYYRKAYELDPTDAYPLGNYLEYEVLRDKDLSIVGLIKPIIDEAIGRCKACIEVGVNIPWAYYDIGKFNLLLGDPYNSFSAYAKAIHLSTASFMVETSLNSLQRLSVVKELLAGYDWIENLFLLRLATKYGTDKSKKEIKKKNISKLKWNELPFVILVGGSGANDEQMMNEYRKLILDSFAGFNGTIISGGTTTGISKLTGDIKVKYSKNILSIGYAPGKASIKVDRNQKRYDEICKTSGGEFSPLEATQYWIDLISSGIDPKQIIVLGISGGKISEVECKLALVMGAKVGIIEGSGGNTSKLFSDSDWKVFNNLIQLPADSAIVKAFIQSTLTELGNDSREAIAKEIHKEYLESRKRVPQYSDPSLDDWENLQENLKESNRHQAEQIFKKLNLIRCATREIKDREITIMKFSNKEIEIMAELEHARWVVERLSDGWKQAANKDVDKKLSPYLVSWELLPEKIRDYDRITVKKIPEYLAKVGIEVYRQ